LYIRDRVARITRPVRELKAFRRQELAPGESVQVEFQLSVNELAYYHRDGSFQAEPGDFDIWVGGDSRADLHTTLRLLKA
jgi:beta-glucosidase